MILEELIRQARLQGASDLHLEAGMPPTLRVRGALLSCGPPIGADSLLQAARSLLTGDDWDEFDRRKSFDLSRVLAGVRCRINVLHSARGVGFAIRLLAIAQVTLEKLNLHPDLARLVEHRHGLVLMSGPTGSGKSSTLAALIHELNHAEPRHIITVEHPVEYLFRPARAFIRQREVGRDTPSFQQAILDALREDFDVLMVGEMRDPETIRLTLGAAETGHLVLATIHSGTSAEALQRVVSAFPAEIQAGVRAQLADCLVGVISQRLRYRPELEMRLPECEILVATHAIKSFVRQGDFFKIASALETGAEHGMWSFPRYQTWMERKKHWHRTSAAEGMEADPALAPVSDSERGSVDENAAPGHSRPVLPSKKRGHIAKPGQPDERIEIVPHDGGLNDLLKRL